MARARLLGGVNRGSHVIGDLDYAPPEWAVDAACATSDPDTFFVADEQRIESLALGAVPAKGRAHRARTLVRVETAKAVCATCAVRDECLAYALRRGEPYGIWGGMTIHERRALRSKEDR